MTVFILKIIAMVTMTADHIAYGFLDGMPALRVIGRIAFLLYAFMTAEGYNHIKDRPERLKDQVIKLGVLCVVSEFAYDFFEVGKPVDWSSQSVMPVLFLGFIGLIITERFAKKPWIIVMYYAATALLTYFTKTNYKFVGVLLIYAFYFYIKYAGKKSFIVKFLILSGIISVYLCIYVWARAGFGGLPAWLEALYKIRFWLIGHYAAMLLIASYNGKPGPRNKVFSIAYSIYYPLHLALMGLVLMFIK